MPALLTKRGESAVVGRHADARVDDEEDRVGGEDRGFRLRPRAARQRGGVAFLQAGGVDHREAQVGELGLALAPVARDAWLVVDERQLLADEPVEQSGLADVRPPDDRDREHQG